MHSSIVQQDQRYFNYVYMPYRPITPPADPLPSSFVLDRSLKVAEAPRSYYEFTLAIQRKIGVNESVWGCKKNQLGEFAWEYYFYKWSYSYSDARAYRAKWVNDSLVPASGTLAKLPNFFMYSIDLDEVDRSDTLHLYTTQDNYGESYAWSKTTDRLSFENEYHFYQPEQKGLAFEKLAQLVGRSLPIAELFRAEYSQCQFSLCVARKPDSACVYFSGLNFETLLFFMAEHNYPAELVSELRRQRSRLNHLLFDFGLDFVTGDGQNCKVTRTAFYGSF